MKERVLNVAILHSLQDWVYYPSQYKVSQTITVYNLESPLFAVQKDCQQRFTCSGWKFRLQIGSCVGLLSSSHNKDSMKTAEQGKARQPPVTLILHCSLSSVPTQTSPALDYSFTQPITTTKPSISKLVNLFPQSQIHNSKALMTIMQTALSHTTPNKLIQSSFQFLLSLTSAKSLEARIYIPITLLVHLHVAFQHFPIKSPAPQILMY